MEYENFGHEMREGNVYYFIPFLFCECVCVCVSLPSLCLNCEQYVLCIFCLLV